MKKIKQYLLKVRSLVSIKTYKRPMFFVISLILIFNLIILSISSWIAMSIDDEYTGFFDAFARGSVKWMLTPDALANIDNSKTMVLAVVVLVMGMILFSGAIIGLSTNLIKEYFQNRKSGSGKIYLSNHIVVLNWNNKVPELVADLLHVEDENLTVVVLADIEKAYAEKQIVNAINKQEHTKEQLSGLNVLVKKGDPLINTDLDEISIESALTVIIMNKDINENATKDITKSDLNVIKTVLNVGRVEFIKSPPIVCEIKKHETKEKIQTMAKVVKTLQDHTIMPICFDRRLGQVIAQTIIHTLMEDVYLSLFSFDGSEVYCLENTTFDDCIENHSECLPLARKGNNLFVVSLNDKTKLKRSPLHLEQKQLKTKKYKEATNLEVYLIGRNNKLEFILSAFNEYEKLYGTEFQAKWIEDDEVKDFVEDINKQTRPITIVLLSDEDQDDDALDANVIDTLIYLEGNLTRTDVKIIVELLDPKNDTIIRDFNINNAIISNKIVSLLISKLALYDCTDSFYENLLTLEISEEEEDDQEVFIRDATELLDEEFPIVFPNKKSLIISVYKSFNEKFIPMGLFRNGVLELFSENLHKDETTTIEQSDFFVLMKLQSDHDKK